MKSIVSVDSVTRTDDISLTLFYLFGSLVLTAASAWLAVLLGYTIMFPFLFAIGYLALAFVTAYLENGYLFALFAIVTGLLIAPTLSLILASAGPQIIIIALLTTAVQVGALSFYAWFTKTNFNQYYATLTSILTAIIMLSFLNIFLGSSMLVVLTSILGVVTFSGLLVYDIQKVRNGEFSSPVVAAMNIYLDVINLFLDILTIFYALTSKDSNDSKLAGERFWHLIGILQGVVIGVFALLTLGYFLEKKSSVKPSSTSTSPGAEQDFSVRNPYTTFGDSTRRPAANPNFAIDDGLEEVDLSYPGSSAPSAPPSTTRTGSTLPSMYPVATPSVLVFPSYA